LGIGSAVCMSGKVIVDFLIFTFQLSKVNVWKTQMVCGAYALQSA
jgi:hypothetical protein